MMKKKAEKELNHPLNQSTAKGEKIVEELAGKERNKDEKLQDCRVARRLNSAHRQERGRKVEKDQKGGDKETEVQKQNQSGTHT